MKEILLCMHSAGNPQRHFLAGVSDFARKQDSWTIRLDPRPAKLTPETYRAEIAAGVSGVIVCEEAIPDLNAIIRIRLEEVRRRLLATSLPISRIAAVCGFSNPSYLKKLFFDRYGERMDSYR